MLLIGFKFSTAHDDAIAVWLLSGNAIEATGKVTNSLMSFLDGAVI